MKMILILQILKIVNEEKNKTFLLDTSSNRINSVNRYTFNTKFCNFNNKKDENKK